MQTILIVEDEEDIRGRIALFLKKEGFQILKAENGKIGLEMALAHHPDLILCDIKMPDMDGIELLKEVRKAPSLLEIPFIFLTVKDSEEDLFKGIDLGAVDYVTKPFDIDVLLARIKIQIELPDYRRELEAELSQKRKDAGEEYEKMVRNAVHDLKDPLTGVIGNASIIQNKFGSDGDLRKYVEKIIRCSTKLDAIINGILDYLNDEPVNLEKLHTGEIVENVVKDNLQKAEKKKQQLTAEIQGEFPVNSDELKLNRILTNLVGNAIKYSEPGKSTRVTLEKSRNSVVIKVIDQGPGFTQEQKEALFSDPRKVGNKPTGGEGSHKYGIKSVLRCLREIGGELQLESEPGKGSTFIVILPAWDRED